MIAILSATPFSCRSGVGRRCARLQQKYLGGALHLGWGQRSDLAVFLLGMPGWAIRLDDTPHQEQLPVGQGHDPHPVLQACQIGGAMAVEPQMLFEKAKQVLDGKTPQVHAAQVLKRRGWRSGPEEPEWAFVTRGAILLQELDANHRPG